MLGPAVGHRLEEKRPKSQVQTRLGECARERNDEGDDTMPAAHHLNSGLQFRGVCGAGVLRSRRLQVFAQTGLVTCTHPGFAFAQGSGPLLKTEEALKSAHADALPSQPVLVKMYRRCAVSRESNTM